MRAVDASQALILSKSDTLPAYLVELGEGLEYHCTIGTRTVDGVTWTGGDVGLSAMQDWSSANVTFSPTAERVAWMLSGAWRGMRCRISLLPGAAFQVFSHDYYSPDYVFQGESFADPILLLPGRLNGASINGDGRVEFTVVHRSRTAKWAPPFRIGPPWCNHLPRPGEVIEWAGERFIVEAR